MSKENFDNEDFEKIFSEIVNSDDLKNMSQTYKSDITLGIKELILVQQALSDSVSHISEIMIALLQNENLLKDPEGEPAELIASLYKISEDFNECMQDKLVEFAIMEDDEDDDEDEEIFNDVDVDDEDINIDDEDTYGDEEGFY